MSASIAKQANYRANDKSGLEQDQHRLRESADAVMIVLVEEQMPDPDSTRRPNSGAGWTFPSPADLNGPTLGRARMLEQVAQSSVIAFSIADSCLMASRQMIDIWRTTVREIEDGLLASWRQQILHTLAPEAAEATDPPSTAETRRPSLRKVQVAATAATPAAQTIGRGRVD